MEDAHTTLTDLEQDNKHISFFAVFDGHGGTHAAKFSGKNLHLNIVKTEEFKEGKYQEALKNGFLNTDSELRAGRFVLNKTRPMNVNLLVVQLLQFL